MQNIILKNTNTALDQHPSISFSVEGIKNKEDLEDALWQIREFATKALEDYRLKQDSKKPRRRELTAWHEKINQIQKKSLGNRKTNPKQ